MFRFKRKPTIYINALTKMGQSIRFKYVFNYKVDDSDIKEVTDIVKEAFTEGSSGYLQIGPHFMQLKDFVYIKISTKGIGNV